MEKLVKGILGDACTTFFIFIFEVFLEGRPWLRNMETGALVPWRCIDIENFLIFFFELAPWRRAFALEKLKRERGALGSLKKLGHPVILFYFCMREFIISRLI